MQRKADRMRFTYAEAMTDPAHYLPLAKAIEIVRGLCAGGYFEYHGEFYDIQRIKLTPAPTAPLPILIGGHSEPALRRAVRLGDGWMHAGSDGAELDRLLARIAWRTRASPTSPESVRARRGHRVARREDRAPATARRSDHRRSRLNPAARGDRVLVQERSRVCLRQCTVTSIVSGGLTPSPNVRPAP